MKQLNSKKGFTLIELLAVILILGIIALIAIPTVNSVIEDSRKEALKTTAIAISDAAERQCQIEQMKGQDITSYYSIANGVFSSPLDIKNSPKNGSIVVDDDCNANVAVSDDNYCAIKQGEQVTVNSNINDCKVLPKTPESCFVFDSSTKTITDYNYDGTICTREVSIPSIIGGEAVEKLGNNAFYGNNLTSVIIPEGITSIGDFAFSHDQLESVTIPDSVTSIGEEAFWGNQLISLVLSNNLISIWSKAFYGNNLISVIIPEGVTEIGDRAFYDNNLKNAKIPNSVFTIGYWAFAYNELTSIVIPEGITTMDYGAFKYNELIEVEIPNTLTTISLEMFAYNQLTSVVIPDGVTSIEFGAFGHNRLTSVTIPDSVTNIGYQAFNDNQLLDDQAFIYARNRDGSIDKKTIVSYGGAKRASIKIPDEIQNISNYAFAYNELESVTIGSGIKSIASNAFSFNSNTVFNINRLSEAVTGAPWGATNATVNWIGSK